jgi:hypothetical protein
VSPWRYNNWGVAKGRGSRGNHRGGGSGSIGRQTEGTAVRDCQVSEARGGAPYRRPTIGRARTSGAQGDLPSGYPAGLRPERSGCRARLVRGRLPSAICGPAPEPAGLLPCRWTVLVTGLPSGAAWARWRALPSATCGLPAAGLLPRPFSEACCGLGGRFPSAIRRLARRASPCPAVPCLRCARLIVRHKMRLL